MAKHEKTKWKEQNIASARLEPLSDLLTVQSYPDHIAVNGECPICHGEISTKSPKRFQAPNGAGDVVGQGSPGPVLWEVVLECNCEQQHAGQPRGSEGCGMALKVGVTDG